MEKKNGDFAKLCDEGKADYRHLDWNHCTSFWCSFSEWETLVEPIFTPSGEVKDGFEAVQHYTSTAEYVQAFQRGKTPVNMRIIKKYDRAYLHIYDGEFKQYIVNGAHDAFDSERVVTPKQSSLFLNTKFLEYNGVNIAKSWGSQSSEWAQFIPKLFITLNDFITRDEDGKLFVFENVNKVDCNSAFPFAASMPVPDTHADATLHLCGADMREVDTEYPFALYPKSKRLVYLDKIDTVKLYDCDEYRRKYNDHFGDVALDDEVYLFKRADGDLSKIYAETFALKQESVGDKRRFYKDLLNLSIGNLHPKPARGRKGFYIQFAFMIANYLQLMIKEIELIKQHKGVIIHVPTDGIIYSGDYVPRSTKAFGGFKVEKKHTTAVFYKINNYSIGKGTRGMNAFELKAQGNPSPEVQNLKNVEEYKTYFDRAIMTEKADENYKMNYFTGKIEKMDDKTQRRFDIGVMARGVSFAHKNN